MGGVVTKIDQNNRAAISGEVTALRQNNANDFIAIEAAYHRNEYKSKFYYGAAGYTVSCGLLYTIFKNTERIPKIYGGLGAIYVWNGGNSKVVKFLFLNFNFCH